MRQTYKEKLNLMFKEAIDPAKMNVVIKVLDKYQQKELSATLSMKIAREIAEKI